MKLVITSINGTTYILYDVVKVYVKDGYFYAIGKYDYEPSYFENIKLIREYEIYEI